MNNFVLVLNSRFKVLPILVILFLYSYLQKSIKTYAAAVSVRNPLSVTQVSVFTFKTTRLLTCPAFEKHMFLRYPHLRVNRNRSTCKYVYKE